MLDSLALDGRQPREGEYRIQNHAEGNGKPLYSYFQEVMANKLSHKDSYSKWQLYFLEKSTLILDDVLRMFWALYPLVFFVPSNIL